MSSSISSILRPSPHALHRATRVYVRKLYSTFGLERLNADSPEAQQDVLHILLSVTTQGYSSTEPKPFQISERELEGVARALLASYTPEEWANANRREVVEGILASVGIEVRR